MNKIIVTNINAKNNIETRSYLINTTRTNTSYFTSIRYSFMLNIPIMYYKILCIHKIFIIKFKR